MEIVAREDDAPEHRCSNCAEESSLLKDLTRAIIICDMRCCHREPKAGGAQGHFWSNSPPMNELVVTGVDCTRRKGAGTIGWHRITGNDGGCVRSQ